MRARAVLAAGVSSIVLACAVSTEPYTWRPAITGKVFRDGVPASEVVVRLSTGRGEKCAGTDPGTVTRADGAFLIPRSEGEVRIGGQNRDEKLMYFFWRLCLRSDFETWVFEQRFEGTSWPPGFVVKCDLAREGLCRVVEATPPAARY